MQLATTNRGNARARACASNRAAAASDAAAGTGATFVYWRVARHQRIHFLRRRRLRVGHELCETFRTPSHRDSFPRRPARGRKLGTSKLEAELLDCVAAPDDRVIPSECQIRPIRSILDEYFDERPPRRPRDRLSSLQLLRTARTDNSIINFDVPPPAGSAAPSWQARRIFLLRSRSHLSEVVGVVVRLRQFHVLPTEAAAARQAG